MHLFNGNYNSIHCDLCSIIELYSVILLYMYVYITDGLMSFIHLKIKSLHTVYYFVYAHIIYIVCSFCHQYTIIFEHLSLCLSDHLTPCLHL